MLRDTQGQVLQGILKRNAETDYGRRFGFSQIETIEEYQRRLPLTNYAFYQPIHQLISRLGERNILTEEEPICYTLSFGPDASVRYIPCTAPYLAMFRQEVQTLGAMGHVFSLYAALPQNKRFGDGLYLNTISGLLLTLSADVGSMTSPKELLFPSDIFDVRYARMLFAIADERVQLIAAPYTGSVIDAFDFLEQHWEALCDDIERGAIPCDKSLPQKYWLPEALLKKLNEVLSPNPERAAALRAAFKGNRAKPLASRIWPNLNLVVAENSATTRHAQHNSTSVLKRYIGEIPLNNGLYFSPEALVATSVRSNCEERKLLAEAGFFEFMPTSFLSNGASRPLLANELEVGEEYGLVVTNCLGFYRYKIGDVVRVERMDKGVPVFSVLYRANATIPSKRNAESEKATDVLTKVEHVLEEITSARAQR